MSSIPHSEGFSAKKRPSLTTYAIIAGTRCWTILVPGTIATVGANCCSAQVTADRISRGTRSNFGTARKLREGKAQSAFKNPWRWQRTMLRTKLRRLCRKASSTLAPPRGRVPATETRLLTTGSRWRRPDREEWQWLKLKRTPQISLAGRSILPRCGKRFHETGQVLSHHQLSSDTATEDDFFETVLL
jgi:hypothetical protein